MKKSIIAFILVSQSFLACASQPFSRELMTSFFATSDKLEKLEKKYPAEFKRMDEFSLTEKSKMISYVKSSKAYDDIASVLSENGFSSIDDFLDVANRFMGSMFAVQMQKMPMGMTLESIDNSFEENIKSMKQNGAPAEMIAGMEAELKQMKKERNEMKMAAKNASKADIKFINDNIEWLKSVSPNDDAHHRQ